ncbi:MAG: hypothetical protein NTU41_12890 [Chloroflexi bacterium]|nr:hypothetical protein [Chloroflexota bacterium]
MPGAYPCRLFSPAGAAIPVFFEVITFSFEKLGLSDGAAIALVSLSLVGSMVNIPLT